MGLLAGEKAETTNGVGKADGGNGFGEAGFVSSLTCGGRDVVWSASPVLMHGVALGRQMAVERARYRTSISGLAAEQRQPLASLSARVCHWRQPQMSELMACPGGTFWP